MEASNIDPKETVSASRKLGAAKAKAIVKAASRIIVAKGKKVREFPGGKATAEVIEAMLGSTGNLRAPLIQRGKTVLVGFNDETYAEVFGR